MMNKSSPAPLPIHSQDEDWAGEDPLAAAQAIDEAHQDIERLIASLAAEGTSSKATAPLYLILSSKSALTRKYGPSTFAQLDTDLRRLKQAVEEFRGIETLVVYVDDDISLAEYGLHPVDPADPRRIKALVDELEAEIGGQRILYMLIVGGESIIPFHKLANPIDDQDEIVLSDNPYASRDANEYIPDRAVGRLPDSEQDGVGFLRSLIHTAITGHQQAARRKGLLDAIAQAFRRADEPAPKNGHGFGYSASIWRKASRVVFEPIGESRNLRISPPLSYDELNVSEPLRFSYFNLHGVEDGPNWYGQRDTLFPADYPLFPVALRPHDLSAATHANSIVFSEACYGAYVIGKTADDSIALRFLASGALALIGSTKVSYGAIAPPLVCADLIGKYFWAGLRARMTVGEALVYAKSSLAREMQRRQGYLDGEDQKTLLSFVLYGDPALPGVHCHPLASAEKSFCPPIICQQQSRQAKSRVADKLADTVEQYIAANLPHMAHAQMHVERIKVCSGQCSSNCSHGRSNAKTTGETAENWTFTLRKELPVAGDSAHRQVVKITVDPQGHVLKMSMSK